MKDKINEICDVPIGTWTRAKGGIKPLPESVLAHRQLLVKLRELLYVQLQQDKQTLSELHEKRSRVKYGGGS